MEVFLQKTQGYNWKLGRKVARLGFSVIKRLCNVAIKKICLLV